MIDPQELFEVVQETLDGIVETIDNPFPSRSYEPPPNRVRATVEVVGQAKAVFTLAVDGPTALALAEVWARFPPDDIQPADAAAVVGELANVLAGSAKTLIDGETRLEVPVVEVDGEADVETSVAVDHVLGRLKVDLAQSVGVSP